MSPLSVLLVVSRLLLATALFYAVTETLSSTSLFDPGYTLTGPRLTLGAAALSGLMTVVAIWLVFGIRTRVVATLGTALYVGHITMLPGFGAVDATILAELALVGAIALPSILFGGGRFSMVRAGWSNVI
ncbi:hypothetical protein SAMN05444413_11183 [Roseivivax marinus]|uniref:hypothetical protein n=1 Tax=Roseivivax marinus TaxID=1379903 RepID=UPI0008C8E5B5|nr:hypothetical protein [Roseivivax marinus]SEL58843.1 hypothetical protein SAMN05444413_11183 [Roseivivax marinus]